MTVYEPHNGVPTGLTPEQVSTVVVAVTSGGMHQVELRAPGLPPVSISRHANPSVVREHADQLRRAIATLIRADRDARMTVLPG